MEVDPEVRVELTRAAGNKATSREAGLLRTSILRMLESLVGL